MLLVPGNAPMFLILWNPSGRAHEFLNCNEIKFGENKLICCVGGSGKNFEPCPKVYIVGCFVCIEGNRGLKGWRGEKVKFEARQCIF